MAYIGSETAFGRRTRGYAQTATTGWAQFGSAGEAQQYLQRRGWSPSMTQAYVKGWEAWNRKQQQQQTIMDEYEAAQAKAREATAAREAEIRGLYDEIIGRYGPEGSFGKGYEAQLERQKTREVAAGGQALVSSGLYGTTQLAGLGKKFEEEVGAPARLKLEDIRAERLSQAQIGKAGFVERIEDIYPDYAMMAKLMAQASS